MPCYENSSWVGFHLCPHAWHTSSALFLPIVPPSKPTGPRSTNPAAAFPRPNPFCPTAQFIERHFGHWMRSPGAFSPQCGHVGAVLETSLPQVLHLARFELRRASDSPFAPNHSSSDSACAGEAGGSERASSDRPGASCGNASGASSTANIISHFRHLALFPREASGAVSCAPQHGHCTLMSTGRSSALYFSVRAAMLLLATSLCKKVSGKATTLGRALAIH